MVFLFGLAILKQMNMGPLEGQIHLLAITTTVVCVVVYLICTNKNKE